MGVAWKEMKKMLPWFIVFNGITVLIIYLFSGWRWALLWGMLLGNIYSVFNFLLLGIAVDKAVHKRPSRAQAYMVTMFLLRYLLTAVLITVSLVTDLFHPAAVIIPIFFPKLALTLQGIFAKKRKEDGRGGA